MKQTTMLVFNTLTKVSFLLNTILTKTIKRAMIIEMSMKRIVPKIISMING